jgi:hypothetical protein
MRKMPCAKLGIPAEKYARGHGDLGHLKPLRFRQEMYGLGIACPVGNQISRVITRGNEKDTGGDEKKTSGGLEPNVYPA